MSIASKLQTVAANEQRVYVAGQTFANNEWERLVTNNYTRYLYLFVNCDTITTLPPLNHSTAGGTDFRNMFQACRKLTTIPPLDTSNGTIFASMFDSCRGLTTVPPLDTSKGTSFTSMFNSCVKLTTVPPLDTSKGTDFRNMFWLCSELQTISLLDFSSANSSLVSGIFKNCTSLTTVTFTGSIKVTGINLQDSPLTIGSLRSLINALEPKTSGTFKVTVGSTNLAKLTPDDLDLISEKGWIFE